MVPREIIKFRKYYRFLYRSAGTDFFILLISDTLLMGIEIERKYLVKNDDWKTDNGFSHYRQGYIFSGEKGVVRVRTIDDRGFLTIKSSAIGLKRHEYEYEIPFNDAVEMFSTLCDDGIIDKKRFKISFGSHVWEVDEFEGLNYGLVLAEIELSDENETFEKPAWIGKEVSDDPRYHNSYLSKHPFSRW
jgi:adenylate cyclase